MLIESKKIPKEDNNAEHNDNDIGDKLDFLESQGKLHMNRCNVFLFFL
jgi:hypothetical protein